MEKKNLKWYDAPQVEVVEMELQGILCGSDGVDDDTNTKRDPNGGEDF